MSSMSFDSVASAAQAPPAATAVQHGHHHGRHHKQVLDSVAKTLDMNDDDVKSALRSGKSLSQLASDKGVSRDDLLKSIEQGLTNGQGQSVDQSRLDAIAQRIADRVPGQRRDADGDDAPTSAPADSPYSVDVRA
jgi:hypothetical protein